MKSDQPSRERILGEQHCRLKCQPMRDSAARTHLAYRAPPCSCRDRKDMAYFGRLLTVRACLGTCWARPLHRKKHLHPRPRPPRAEARARLRDDHERRWEALAHLGATAEKWDLRAHSDPDRDLVLLAEDEVALLENSSPPPRKSSFLAINSTASNFRRVRGRRGRGGGCGGECSGRGGCGLRSFRGGGRAGAYHRLRQIS